MPVDKKEYPHVQVKFMINLLTHVRKDKRGISRGRIAEICEISPTTSYLYRILKDLEEAGVVKIIEKSKRDNIIHVNPSKLSSFIFAQAETQFWFNHLSEEDHVLPMPF